MEKIKLTLKHKISKNSKKITKTKPALVQDKR